MKKEIKIISRQEALLIARNPQATVQNLIKKINRAIRSATEEDLLTKDIVVPTGLSKISSDIRGTIKALLNDNGWKNTTTFSGPNSDEIFILLKAPVK